MLSGLLLAAVCTIPTTYSPTPVVRWDYDQYQIDHRAVDGFVVQADGVEVATIPCLVRAICDDPNIPIGVCIEIYECAGVRVEVPLQRWIDRPAGETVEITAYAYNSGGPGDISQPLTVCWPRTVYYDTSGETGRNW